MLPRFPQQLRYLLASLVLISISVLALQPVCTRAASAEPPGAGQTLLLGVRG